MVVRTMNEEGGRRKVPCARALFAFASETELELSFSAGVSIMLLRRIDENWLEGQLDGRVGIFPASHVKIELSSPSLTRDSALAGSGRPYAIALYSFSGAEAGDLCFGKGELIELLGPAGSGWMRGRISEHTGIFPSSFVEVLKDTVEHPIPKPRSRHTSAPQLVCRPSPGSVTREEHPTPTRSAPAPPSDSPASPKKVRLWCVPVYLSQYCAVCVCVCVCRCTQAVHFRSRRLVRSSLATPLSLQQNSDYNRN